MLDLLAAWPLLLSAGVLITAFLLYCVLRFGESAAKPWALPLNHSYFRQGASCAWCYDCNVACWSNDQCFCCRETR